MEELYRARLKEKQHGALIYFLDVQFPRISMSSTSGNSWNSPLSGFYGGFIMQA